MEKSPVKIAPLLEENIKIICEGLYKKSLPINTEKILIGLKEKRFPVSSQTSRVIQFYLDNTDIPSVVAASILEKEDKEKSKKTKASSISNSNSNNEFKSPSAKKTKLNHISMGNDIKVNGSTTNYLCQVRPTLRLSHLAGIESIISKITELIFNPIYMSTIYENINIQPTCTILFHGPTGCGKTSIANAIAGELNVPYFRVSAPELIGSMSGESEQRIKMLFSQAVSSGAPISHSAPNVSNAEGSSQSQVSGGGGMSMDVDGDAQSNNTNTNTNSNTNTNMNSSMNTSVKCMPTIVFIDNIDVIAGKSEGNSKGMDKRVIATLAQCIDDVINCSKNIPDGPDGPGKSTESAGAAGLAGGQINMNNIDNGDAEVNNQHDPVLKDQEVKQKSSKLVIFIACTNK